MLPQARACLPTIEKSTDNKPFQTARNTQHTEQTSSSKVSFSSPIDFPSPHPRAQKLIKFSVPEIKFQAFALFLNTSLISAKLRRFLVPDKPRTIIFVSAKAMARELFPVSVLPSSVACRRMISDR